MAAFDLQPALYGHIAELGDGLSRLQIGGVTGQGHGIGTVGDKAAQLGQHLRQRLTDR
ncbi:hypothetical protein D3C85_1928330 [compost metagenome]